MKRSAALAALSRDHQHALDAALRLRRADAASVEAAIERFRSFFADEGRRHFEIEEQLILPALPANDSEWGPGRERVLADHEAIRRQAAELASAQDLVVAARTLGEQLHAHVRFEERTLFEILERRLPAQRLDRLGTLVADAERRPMRPPL